jgi:hypothetical protein
MGARLVGLQASIGLPYDKLMTGAQDKRTAAAGEKIYGPPPFCNLISYDVSRLAQIYPASDGDLLRATMRVAPVGPKKPLGL